MAGEKKDLSNQPGKIAIISSGEISHPTLRNYLRHRQIPLAIANEFCRKVTFELYGKKQRAIGFQNPSGGYELRNHYFKGSSSPKESAELIKMKKKSWLYLKDFLVFFLFKHCSSQRRNMTAFIYS